MTDASEIDKIKALGSPLWPASDSDSRLTDGLSALSEFSVYSVSVHSEWVKRCTRHAEKSHTHIKIGRRKKTSWTMCSPIVRMHHQRRRVKPTVNLHKHWSWRLSIKRHFQTATIHTSSPYSTHYWNQGVFPVVSFPACEIFPGDISRWEFRTWHRKVSHNPIEACMGDAIYERRRSTICSWCTASLCTMFISPH